jgi:nitrogen regulatory protein P-II 1
MKQVTAIIQPHMLAKVEHALHELEHFPGFTLQRAKGHGRAIANADGKGALDFDEHDKLLLLMFCSDAIVSRIVETIRSSAYTGLPGDGLIAVSEVAEVVRIRTGEHGEDAV